MDENNENLQRKEKFYSGTNCHWGKFALLLLSLFLACYLATYYILDQIRHSYYVPSAPMEKIDKIIQEQDKLFNQDFGTLPMHNKVLKMMKNPVEIYKDTEKNAYKIVVDLKHFDGNPNNINFEVVDNKVNLNAISENIKNNKENIYTLSQSFELPESVDEKNVTKEKVGNKYIITLPIENPLADEDDD